MTFSQQVKAELCEPRVERKCCAVAEAYGILLYCHTFSPKLIRIITASGELAQRLPHLFKKAFGVSFDELDEGSGKRSFRITDEKKIQTIYDTFGNDINTPSLHINFGVLEEPCCKASFIRGAFLAGGSVTDPGKRYHLELATSHYSVSREAYSILLDMGFSPKEAERKGNHLLYFKKSEHIEDLLTTIGASTCGLFSTPTPNGVVSCFGFNDSYFHYTYASCKWGELQTLVFVPDPNGTVKSIPAGTRFRLKGWKK